MGKGALKFEKQLRRMRGDEASADAARGLGLDSGELRREAVKLAFWDRLRDLLMAVERDLTAWCVLESDLDEDAIGTLFAVRREPDERELMSAADLDGRPDPKLARKLAGALAQKRLGQRRRGALWDIGQQ